MSRIAILVPDLAGHLLPAGELGNELQRRGHEVTFVSWRRAASVAERLELPLRELAEDGVRPRRISRLRWLGGKLLGIGWVVTVEGRLCWKAEQILGQAPEILRELRAECVVVDQDILAGGTVAERLGVPHVTFCSGLLWNEEPAVPPHCTGWPADRGWVARLRNRIGYAAWQAHLRPALETTNRQRRAWNLPRLRRFGDTFSRHAQICQMCAELDFPRSRLAPCCHYVGSLAAHRTDEVEFPWDRLDGRPLVYASLGTLPGGENADVYRRIATACAGAGVQLVLGLGQWARRGGTAEDGLGMLPGAPVVVGYAPQLALLARAALLITHGGLNTVLEALLHGVPMVCLPRFADHPGMAARVAWAGAGLHASFARSTADQLGEMVRRLLRDTSFRERAGAIGRALAAAGGPTRAADIVEQVLATGAPVHRVSAPAPPDLPVPT